MGLLLAVRTLGHSEVSVSYKITSIFNGEGDLHSRRGPRRRLSSGRLRKRRSYMFS